MNEPMNGVEGAVVQVGGKRAAKGKWKPGGRGRPPAWAKKSGGAKAKRARTKAARRNGSHAPKAPAPSPVAAQEKAQVILSPLEMLGDIQLRLPLTFELEELAIDDAFTKEARKQLLVAARALRLLRDELQVARVLIRDGGAS